MRKITALFLALVLLLSLGACASDGPAPTDVPTEVFAEESTAPTEEPEQTTEPATEETVFTFPADTTVCGVDLGGMTAREGRKALSKAVSAYRLSLRVNDEDLMVSASDMGLALDNAAFDAFCETAAAGEEGPGELLAYDREALVAFLSDALEVSAQNAGVTYSSAKKKFVVREESSGVDYDVEAIADAADAAIRALTPELAVDASPRSIRPTITTESPELQAALDSANSYLKVSLTYTFTPEGGETASETLSVDTIASFVSVSDSLSVSISRTAVRSFASKMDDRHSVADHTGNFRATGGGTVGLTVDYYGQAVDTAALTEDICNCVTKGISGTRTAPYCALTQAESMPYGGNYVEVNLSAQYLWVYRNGECVVSTPIVSGCVANGDRTPTGVYRVSDLDRDCWLVGSTWRDFVNYWIGFSGTYGIHDASWRSEFGGEIYLFEGSHGCVNLPVGVAGSVYANVGIGTRVILYGGASSAEPLQQQITGTESYDVASDAAAFKLDAVLKYPEAQVTYSSDNPGVATVSADGTVAVTGQGTATITVAAEPFTHHTGAKLEIRITVHSPCQEGRHSFGDWVETEAPGCEVPGKRTAACALCGAEQVEEIPATGHSFTDDSPYCRNGCGKENPDYLPPDTDPSDPEETEEPAP